MHADIHAGTPAEPPPARPLVVLATGLCAWLATAGYTWHTLPAAVVTRMCALFALLVLGVGVFAVRVPAPARRAKRTAGARWLLLTAFPCALAGTLLGHDPRELSAVHTASSLPLSLGTLLLYFAVALSALRQHGPRFSVHIRPLGPGQGSPPASPAKMQGFLRGAAVATFVVGACAIALVAPLWPGYDALLDDWSASTANASAVLTAVVAGALGTAIAGLFLGSLLRKSEAPRSLHARELRARVASMLLLSLLGLFVYFTVAR